ncbi:MAG: ribonuclease HI family protein [Candidatus Doudnabacteria bacterium]|nr:ribonuclease HI family protein [Candidatus Doudnabacteria bacterium]
MDKLVIYTDGGARGNPGPAAIGVAIFDIANTHDPIKTYGKYLGETTNNQAEYRALLAGLDLAKDLGAKHIVCFLDSELVVKQVTGLYKIREAGLQELAMDVIRAKNNFEQVEFKHVPREKNKLADALVNDALDKEAGK